MNITLRQLGYFTALAEHRNFGRAARAVNVSQPALSVQIREMETTLGQPLVERRARDVVLTPFGRTILDHAARVLAEMQDLGDAARWQAGLTGRLSLGLIPTIAPYLLPPALAALRSGDISLDVHISEAKTETLIEGLQSGHLDAAVMALPVDVPGLSAEPLFADRFLLAGSAARLAALGHGREALRPTALDTAQLLLLEDGHCMTDQVLDICGRGRGHAQIDMGTSSLPTLSRLVAAGFGLTLMPELAARAEAQAAPGLCLARFAAPEPARRIALVRRSSSRAEKWFTDLAALLARAGRQIVDDLRDTEDMVDMSSATSANVA